MIIVKNIYLVMYKEYKGARGFVISLHLHVSIDRVDK